MAVEYDPVADRYFADLASLSQSYYEHFSDAALWVESTEGDMRPKSDFDLLREGYTKAEQYLYGQSSPRVTWSAP